MEWINVKTRLPEDDEPVLVTTNSHHYLVEQVGARELRHYTEEAARMEQNPIWTHWMPRPARPKSLSSEGTQP